MSEMLTQERIARRSPTGNTSIIPYKGKLLDGLPYEKDSETLKLTRVYHFKVNGMVRPLLLIPSMIHRQEKWSPLAKGEATKDIFIASIKKHGKLTDQYWIETHVAGHVPIISRHMSLDLMRAGGRGWQWQPHSPYYISILTRRNPKTSDVKDGEIHLYMTVADGIVFGFLFPDKDGNAPPFSVHPSHLSKWEIGPTSSNLKLDPNKFSFNSTMNFPVSKGFGYIFGNLRDDNLGSTDWEFLSTRVGGFTPFNSIFKYDVETTKLVTYSDGPHRLYQGPDFIPRFPLLQKAMVGQ
ncbi:hypothetical protein LTR84_011954 [Exophiala bonariae]|uniref:Uncharacterized protein n=1 Tax=Exophiala bonariae TaxID=1690606 RepID=A0AAV9MTB7_9EURO|nr:hypothetical protein LTR84_011954 [Exophiala bonariae]